MELAAAGRWWWIADLYHGGRRSISCWGARCMLERIAIKVLHVDGRGQKTGRAVCMHATCSCALSYMVRAVGMYTSEHAIANNGGRLD
jgi:hypothetical protein